MKLYSNPISPNCRKVHALLKHLDLAIDRETVDLRAGAHKQTSYLALNPNGKVPTLVDGKRVIWESNAILAYLASRRETSLWPKGDEQYEIMKWMSWENCHLGPAVGKVITQVIFAPMRGAEPDQKLLQQGIEEFRKYCVIADAQLATTKFLVGDALTIADFAVATWLSYEQICGLPVSDYVHLARWWKAMQGISGGAEFAVPRPQPKS